MLPQCNQKTCFCWAERMNARTKKKKMCRKQKKGKERLKLSGKRIGTLDMLSFLSDVTACASDKRYQKWNDNIFWTFDDNIHVPFVCILVLAWFVLCVWECRLYRTTAYLLLRWCVYELGDVYNVDAIRSPNGPEVTRDDDNPCVVVSTRREDYEWMEDACERCPDIQNAGICTTYCETYAGSKKE